MAQTGEEDLSKNPLKFLNPIKNLQKKFGTPTNIMKNILILQHHAPSNPSAELEYIPFFAMIFVSIRIPLITYKHKDVFIMFSVSLSFLHQGILSWFKNYTPG